MSHRNCLDCGVDISRRHGNAVRCESCSVLRQREVVGIGARKQPCAVDDAECIPGRLKRGLCDLHYKRQRRTGTTSAPERIDHLQRYEVDENSCWLWTGTVYWNGYGSISEATYGTGLAHRASYEHHIGPIPEGMDLDHLCRVRRCINPEHLEPVTHSVNIQRGHDARMAGRCHQGHDLTAPSAKWTEPSTGRSYCRQCKASREKAGRERRKAG